MNNLPSRRKCPALWGLISPGFAFILRPRYSWLLFCYFLLQLCACGAETTPTFVVVVDATGATFETYEVRAKSYETRTSRYFKYDKWQEELRFVEPLTELFGHTVYIESYRGGEIVDSVSLRPFVCDDDPDYHKRLKEGWKITEHHELLLDEDGHFHKNVDLDRILYYTCEMSASDGANGDGVGTTVSTPEHCDEPDRANTHVQLEIAHADGSSETLSPQTCGAAYFEAHGGRVYHTFIFNQTKHTEISAGVVAHFEPRDVSYPRDMNWAPHSTNSATPSFGGVVEIMNMSSEEPPVDIFWSAGEWHITNIDFRDGGHIHSRVDAWAHDDDSDTDYHLTGSVDLPLIRYPDTAGQAQHPPAPTDR